MQWCEIFSKDVQPTMEDMANYIGGDAKTQWQSLLEYMEKEYKVKPKFSYSGCSFKPGWNIKLQKSGQSFGTFYPEENSFSIFMVISYKLEPEFEALIPTLSDDMAELCKQAGDYMKLGKYIMFQVKDSKTIEDYKKIAAIKAIKKVKK